MPLSLQPAIISVPSDGLPAQPQTKDSESTQALSFGEVLKVEEKKLQQEQETSALSIAALFVTIQPPVVLDSIPRLDSSTDGASTQSNDQTTPTVDSVKSANVSPQQAFPINSKPAAYQGSSPITQASLPNTAGNTLSTNKAGTTAASTTDTETSGKKTGVRIAVHAASNQSLPKVDTASIMPGETTTIEKQPSQTTQPEIRIVEKNKISNPEKVMVEADQTVKNIPVKVQSSASETNLSDANIAVNQSGPELAPVQANATGNEIPQSVREIKTPNIKVILDQSESTPVVGQEIKNEQKAFQAEVKPTQADMTGDEPSQPVSKANTSSVNVILEQSRNAPAIGHEIKSEQKTFQAEVKLTQIDMTGNEIRQPANKANLPTAKVVVDQSKNAPVVDIEGGSDQRSLMANEKPSAPAQANVVVDEIQRPATPTTKVLVEQSENVPVSEHEIKSEQKTVKAEVKSDQTNATGDEVSRPVSKTNISVEAKVTTETESTIQTPIRTVEQKEIAGSSTVPPQKNLSSVEMETFLKQRNSQAEAPVTTDNVTAKNQPETGNMPKVKGEALVLDQENIPASVKPVDAAQSTEKTSAKETDKKPALDLESTFTSVGTNKSAVDVKAAEKLSANRIDPADMNVIEQITSQLKARIKSGETSISLQLDPGELGKIEVQMTHSAQGVSVSFITEQASTGQLIESQVNQLRQSLKEAGVQLANLNISQQHQSNQEGGAFRQGQPFMQNPRRDVPQTEPVEERMRPQRIGSLTGEIDYLI